MTKIKMDHPPDWYRALTLSERIKMSEGRPQPINGAKPGAARRLQQWRSQAPFATDGYFAQRLGLDGLDENKLAQLLDETAEAMQQRMAQPPAWIVELKEALADTSVRNPFAYKSPSLPESLHDQQAVLFLNAVAPFIHRGCQRLQEGIRTLHAAHTNLPFDPDTVPELLLLNLPRRLLQMINRTLILELNVARLQGVLTGDTSEARFVSFAKRLCQPEVMQALWQEYPVLVRQVMMSVEQWVRCSLEFLGHLCADWQAIQTLFNLEGPPGILTRIEGGAGDQHRQGRSVMMVQFSSGFQVVYKPRSLAVEQHFQELLAWLNAHGQQHPFRTVKVLDRHTHGWVEFIQARPCTTSDEVVRFYERQGGYLALLYAIEATDFHFENLVAAADQPVLVDLESLFHPRVEEHAGQPALMTLAGQKMAYSVLRTGLLPQRVWANEASDGVDISGLGTLDGQLSPYPTLQWDALGTDEMHIARKRIPMTGGSNRPTLNGDPVRLIDHVDAIMNGFTRTYQLLLTHRKGLLADDGPLARFKDDEIRAIMRPTHTYFVLLQESFHPDLLRDALDRDRHFDHLWLGINRLPYLATLIPAEREQLWQGDVPFFATRPGSRHLWTDTGHCVHDFFEESGMHYAYYRLQQLSETDMDQQLWFIRAALATIAETPHRPSGGKYQLPESATAVSQTVLRAAACAIGDQLEAMCLKEAQEVSWIGLTLTNNRYWSLVPLGVDLYSGLPGIALFLAYLGTITGEPRYTQLARDTTATIKNLLKANQAQLTTLGAFNGWGGIIYTWVHLGVLWCQPDLLAEAEEYTHLLTTFIKEDKELDIIGGAAGCIGALLSLYHVTASDPALRAAVQCGDYLISQAHTYGQGIGWLTHEKQDKPLAGFSHGAAGIAWALLELAAVTGHKRFHTAALAAISYERSCFSETARNWPDLRAPEILGLDVDDGRPRFATLWCHGAPGIGLARLRALRHYDAPDIRAEIDMALETTLNQGFGLNHCLCHGDLGNLETILQASLMLDDPQWEAHRRRLTAGIMASSKEHGWLCGSTLSVEEPGLMTGLAGIGYQLLRLAEPGHVPSVLALEPPNLV